LVEHAVREVVHEAGFLDQVEEAVGEEQPTRGVVPSDQRLDPAYLAAPQVDLRLIVNDELVVGECRPELLEQPEPGVAAGVVRAAEHALADPTGLRAVHRHVRPTKQLTEIVALFGEQRDPDADVGPQGDSLQRERRREPGPQPGRHGHRLVAVGVAEQDCELVSAQSGQQILGP
jgi:hypothetical protein